MTRAFLNNIFFSVPLFSMQTAAYWVDKLKLQPHPEGGYYSETYRSADFTRCLPDRFPDGQDRRFSTAIYFLLEEGEGRCSHFHRIKSDELWHFYAGSSLTVHIIDDTGKYSAIKVGPDFDKGQVFQAVVHEGKLVLSSAQTL